MKQSDFLFSIIAVATLPVSVWAQTSSVSLTGATIDSGSVLEIRDSEYPLSSLLANQEGDVKLSFMVDATGHAADIRILSSSGSQILDQQSSRLLGSKWTFQPTQPDRTAEMTIGWKVPLERISDYDVKLPSPVVDSAALVQIVSHAVQANDFPGASLRNGEAGIVALRYVVGTDGKIASVEIAETSGIKRLDDSAVAMVKERWRFQPVMEEQTHSATMSFHIIPARAAPRCYPAPVIAEEEVMISAAATRMAGPPIDRWVLVTGQGEISDVLIRAKNQLMRVSQPLRAVFAGSKHPRPPAAGCWYYDPIYLSN